MNREVDSVDYSAGANFSYFLLFMAQNTAMQFFSVYLKYLGLSASDTGTLRALQTWTGLAASLSSRVLSRLLFAGACGRKSFTALLLLTTVAGYVSLVFVPPFAIPRDVTHCLHTRITATNSGLFVPDNRNITGDMVANKSFHAIVQQRKDTAFDISSPEIKTAAKSLQSKAISVTPATNRLSNDYYDWNGLNSLSNGEIKTYEPPKHDSGAPNFKHTFKDKSFGKDGFTVSWHAGGQNGVVGPYNKMEKIPVIFKDVNPVAEHYQENSVSYSSAHQSEGSVLVTPEYHDTENLLHRSRPVSSTSQHKYHYQWRGQNKKNGLESDGDSRTQAQNDRKTFDDPRWRTFQKIFLHHQQNSHKNVMTQAKTYGYKQPFHFRKHPDQQSHASDSALYFSNNPKKVFSIQQEEEEPEENWNFPQQHETVKPSYRQHVLSPHVDENEIFKRSLDSTGHRKVSSGDIAEDVNGVKLSHLEEVTSSHTILSDTSSRKAVSDNMLPNSLSLLQTDIILNNHLNTTSEKSDNSLSVVNTMYAHGIEYFSALQGFGGSKYGSWSTVFYTVIVISLFLEAGCQSTLVWILRICGVTIQDTSVVINEISISCRVLVGWSIMVCPLVGLVVILSPCPYQITAHMVVAAALTLYALFLLPLVSPASKSRKRKPSKPSYRKTYEGFHDTLIKRFSSSLRMGITGCIVACNLEFLMWYMETQETFTHNYEYLYCGYSATASLTHFLLNRLLRKRTGAPEEAESETEDEMDTGSWQPHSRQVTVYQQQWWWFWELGTLLLGIQQLAAQLQPVWVLPPLLGVLQGAGYALSFGGTATNVKTSYDIGYGCGCLAAGIIVQKWGAASLFRVLSLVTSVCAALAAVVRGVARCSSNQRQVTAYPFSIASAESDAGSDGEENEVTETDDWLVQALQQDEYQQAKKNHRLEC